MSNKREIWQQEEGRRDCILLWSLDWLSEIVVSLGVAAFSTKL